MATQSMKNLLQQWFREELAEAPIADPRRTPDCLRFDELEEYAAHTLPLTSQRETHVTSCVWCQRNLALNAARSTLSIDQMASATWSPALGDLLARYATAGSGDSPSTAPVGSARFDAEGILQIHWQGVPFDGPARVQVLYEGRTVTLARGEVQNGTFTSSMPHPELGLYDVELPLETLRVERDVELSQEALRLEPVVPES